MFLSKLKLAAAGLLAAMVLVSATGFIMSQASGPGAQERGSQANDSDAQPRNAAPPAQALGEGHRGTVTASEIGKVYLTNEAQADEDFTGKRIAVTGGMERIKAQDFFSGTDKNSLPIKKRRVYYLEMPWAEYEPGPRLSIPKAPDYAGIIRFHFTEQDRKQLANLRRYQVMTIVGKCIGTDFQEKEGQQILNFDDCKILKAEKPRAHDP